METKFKDSSNAIHPPLWEHELKGNNSQTPKNTKFTYPSFLPQNAGSDSNTVWFSSVPPAGGRLLWHFAQTDSSGSRFPSSFPEAHIYSVIIKTDTPENYV